MGLTVTSNPCPTEHGPIRFPTVTHRVAYLGTRQPAVGTREVGNLASDRPFVLQATLDRTACKTLTGKDLFS
jgi:hypothetical protein